MEARVEPVVCLARGSMTPKGETYVILSKAGWQNYKHISPAKTLMKSCLIALCHAQHFTIECNTTLFGFAISTCHASRMPINEILQSHWCCDYSCSDTSAICDCYQTLVRAWVWLP